MRWLRARRLRAFFVRLGGVFNRERCERELSDELASHVALHIEDNLHAGMTAEEAKKLILVTAHRRESFGDGFERICAAIAKLAEEDPSLSFVQDQASGEMKLFGQGEMHVRVALEKLAARFGVTVEAKKPSVSYCETIREATTIRGRHKKQSGGHGQFGDVVIDIKPRGRSEGFVFDEIVHGRTVPRQYFSSV